MSNTNMMQWEQQSIDTKHNSKYHKANKKTNIKKNKQNKVFLLTQHFLPLDICISPKKYIFPYKCAREIEFFLPKNVHKNHIEMTKYSGILL